MKFENLNFAEPRGWGGIKAERIKARMIDELERALEARKPKSRDLFEDWYGGIEKEMRASALANQDPAFVATMTAAVKHLALTTWLAREPELAFADVQVKAAAQVMEGWQEAKAENERLKADIKQLHWTIDHVLDGGAKPT